MDELDEYAESDAYNELEKTVIVFAEQLTQEAVVDETIMAKLREGLSPEHLVKLAATVGQANWTNRFNNAFGVELP